MTIDAASSPTTILPSPPRSPTTSTANGFEIVGPASDGRRAVALAAEQPELALVDFRMPRLSGTSSCSRRSTDRPAETRICVYTADADEATGRRRALPPVPRRSCSRRRRSPTSSARSRAGARGRLVRRPRRRPPERVHGNPDPARARRARGCSPRACRTRRSDADSVSAPRPCVHTCARHPAGSARRPARRRSQRRCDWG